MTLADDYREYLNGSSQFEESHFEYALVATDPDARVSAEELFAFAPYPSIPAQRIAELVSNTTFNGLYYLPARDRMKPGNELLALAQNMRLEIGKVAASVIDEQTGRAYAQKPINTTEDRDQFERVLLRENYSADPVMMKVNRIFNRSYSRKYEGYYGAREAVSSMTRDLFVTNYILEGIERFHTDFRFGFDLYVGGGELTHDELGNGLLFIPTANAGVA